MSLIQASPPERTNSTTTRGSALHSLGTSGLDCHSGDCPVGCLSLSHSVGAGWSVFKYFNQSVFTVILYIAQTTHNSGRNSELLNVKAGGTHVCSCK